ncbi:TPA: hypothetical protein ACOXWE_004563 [Salmonella enterica]
MILIFVLIVSVIIIAAQLLFRYYAPDLADSKEALEIMFISLCGCISALGNIAMKHSNLRRTAWFIPLIAVLAILWISTCVRLLALIF